MKKVIIIILAVLIAVSGALLIYGAAQGPQKEFNQESKGLLAAPAAAISEGADHWYSLDSVLSSGSFQEKAAKLMVYTSYNQMYAKQFYFSAHVDVFAGNKYTCSDYFRAQQGVNTFYQALAYTGTQLTNMATRRVDYHNVRYSKVEPGISYDKKEQTYSFSLANPDVDDRETTLPRETPYLIYSWYDIPLDFGSKEQAYNEIDSSLIENVSLESPTSDAPYYVLNFSADIDKVNASEETLRRLNEGTGGAMKDIEVLGLSFKAEIWPSGLFRSISVHARIIAKVSNKRGEATIDRTYGFSYDDADCSIANWFKSTGWDKYLTAEGKVAYESELALLKTEEE